MNTSGAIQPHERHRLLEEVLVPVEPDDEADDRERR